MRVPAGRIPLFLVATSLAGGSSSRAADVVLVPDTAITLPGIAVPVLDRGAVREHLGPLPERRYLGVPDGVPDGVAIAAFDYDSGGRPVFVLDGWTTLAGAGTVGPLHVVRLESSGSFSVVLDLTAGVQNGAAIDALRSEAMGWWTVSFDVSVAAAGYTWDDEDLVSVAADGEIDGGLFQSGQVEDGLDLDGLSRHPTNVLLFAFSFDGSGASGGVDFDDEDIVGWNGQEMTVLFDGSAVDESWTAAGLAAFALLPDAIFADDFESADTGAWSSTSPP